MNDRIWGNVEFLKNNKRTLFAIFLTFSLDALSTTIVFPILTPLFLDPERGLFVVGYSPFAKTVFLGICLSIFPLAQFIFSPICGQIADSIGRKRVFFLQSC